MLKCSCTYIYRFSFESLSYPLGATYTTGKNTALQEQPNPTQTTTRSSTISLFRSTSHMTSLSELGFRKTEIKNKIGWIEYFSTIKKMRPTNLSDFQSFLPNAHHRKRYPKFETKLSICSRRKTNPPPLHTFTLIRFRNKKAKSSPAPCFLPAR